MPLLPDATASLCRLGYFVDFGLVSKCTQDAKLNAKKRFVADDRPSNMRSVLVKRRAPDNHTAVLLR